MSSQSDDNNEKPVTRQNDPSIAGEASESSIPSHGESRKQSHSASGVTPHPEMSDSEQPPLPDELPPSDAPPLPNEPTPSEAPPLPVEPPPGQAPAPANDGWQPIWDSTHQAFYFYNQFTRATTWTNPRVPDASSAPGPSNSLSEVKKTQYSGYNPAIHGDYDPTAPYAQAPPDEPDTPLPPPLPSAPAAKGSAAPGAKYEAEGHFNRFTGKWQAADKRPENYGDEGRAMRQMSAFFDVEAAGNEHDGRSLRAERAEKAKKLTKKELKAFQEKRRLKKEENRRAWLMDDEPVRKKKYRY
jgi:hypothetical protein